MIFLQELPATETDSGAAFDAGFRMQPWNSALDISSDGASYLIAPKAFPLDMTAHRCALRTIIGPRYLNICADEGVFLTKRSSERADVYFLCNDNSMTASATFDVLPGMRILDPNTREEAVYTVENGRVSLTLDGYDMLAIVCDKQADQLPVTTKESVAERRTVTLNAPYEFTPADGNYVVYFKDNGSPVWASVLVPSSPVT